MYANTLAVLSILLSAQASLAAPQPGGNSTSNTHHVKRAESHEVVALFKRQEYNSTNYPSAGAIPPTSSLPKAWTDKLSSLRLPTIPVATGAETGRPVYAGFSPTSPEVCSFTYECDAADDLTIPPAGRLALTFDDGPAEGSEALWGILGELGAKGQATHFMIGSYITRNPALFDRIASEGGHIGVHTWSHNYMTTLSNEAVLGELGWAMQLMADRNGGRIPRYWRPPYGDVDNRVRAIAKGVFGLETVTWNQDTGDWNLDQGKGVTIDTISATFISWLGDKSRGLNVLEHEVRPSQPQVVKNVYPKAKELGWQVGNVADAWNMPWYHNAASMNSTVVSMAVGAAALSLSGGAAATGSSASVSSSVSSASSSAASSSASTTPSSASSAAVSPSRSISSSPSGSAVVAAAASFSRSAAGQGVIVHAQSIPLLALGAVAGWLVL